MPKGMELKSKMPQEECPYCHKDRGWFHHGICPHCKKCCGCSFDPTNFNDYCSDHKPR